MGLNNHDNNVREEMKLLTRKVKDLIYRVEFKIRGSCRYLVTAYFFWIEKIHQDISCDTRDVLVQ